MQFDMYLRLFLLLLFCAGSLGQDGGDLDVSDHQEVSARYQERFSSASFGIAGGLLALCLLLATSFGQYLSEVTVNTIRVFVAKSSLPEDLTRDTGDFHYTRVSLGDLTPFYGNLVVRIPWVSGTWSMFGVSVAVLSACDPYRQVLYLHVITVWVFVSVVALLLPFLVFATKYVDFLPSIYEVVSSGLFKFIILAVLVSFGIGSVVSELSVPTIVTSFFLIPPSMLSIYFVAQYYPIFLIHQYFGLRGWDYIDAEATPSVKYNPMAYVGLVSSFLGPLFVIKSMLDITVLPQSEEGNESPIDQFLPSFLIVFVNLGPLLVAVFEPAAFLELLLNSEVYTTLSEFSLEMFNQRVKENREVIDVKLQPKPVVRGIFLLYFAFTIYVSVATVVSIIDVMEVDLDVDIGGVEVGLQWIEFPVYMIVLFTVISDLSEERDVYDIAKLGSLEGRDIVGWMFFILEALYSGQNQFVIDKCDEILNNPETSRNERALLFKGVTLSIQGDYPKAKQILQQATDINPRIIDAWVEQAICLQRQGFTGDKVLEPLMKALKSKPNSVTVLSNIGRVYEKEGNIKEAIKWYRKGTRGNYPMAWASLALLLVRKWDVDKTDENYKKARKVVLEAVVRAPNDHLIPLALCELLHETERDLLRKTLMVLAGREDTRASSCIMLIHLMGYARRYAFPTVADTIGPKLIRWNLLNVEMAENWIVSHRPREGSDVNKCIATLDNIERQRKPEFSDHELSLLRETLGNILVQNGHVRGLELMLDALQLSFDIARLPSFFMSANTSKKLNHKYMVKAMTTLRKSGASDEEFCMALGSAAKHLDAKTQLWPMFEALRQKGHRSGFVGMHQYYVEDKDKSKQREILEELIVTPDIANADDYNNLASLLIDMRDIKNADTTLTTALRKYPVNSDLIHTRIRYLESVQKESKIPVLVSKKLKEARQASPEEYDAVFALAIDTSSGDEKITLLKDGLRRHPDRALYHKMLGEEYTKRQEFKKATESFENYLKLNPDDYQCRVVMAQTSVRTAEGYQDCEYALAQVQRAVKDARRFQDEQAVAKFDEIERQVLNAMEAVV